MLAEQSITCIEDLGHVETITLTIRGKSYSRELPTNAVDLMLAAFRDQYNKTYCPRDESGEFVVMEDSEFFALCLRKFSSEVTAGYAAKLDSELTPNMDAVRPIVESVDK